MSGIYSDPRYEALGLTDTTQARAADQFYGSVPMAMGPMGGYGGQMGGFQDEDDLQVAYEQDIVRRLGQIDPTTPDYEFRVQEFFANEPDPDAAGYGRVRLAANALLGRSGLLKQAAQQSLAQQKEAQKREIELRSQLAEEGLDPRLFKDLTDANGRLKIDDAYFQLGQLKRTNGQSGKYDPASLTAQENEELIKAVAPLNIEPTDEEKVLAWQQATGSSDRPQNTKDWQDAYGYVKNPRIAQAQGLIRTYQQLGRQVPAGILSQAGIQPSVVSSSPTAQSNPSPAEGNSGNNPQPPSPPTDSESRNLSMAQAAAAERAMRDQEQVTSRQQTANDQWNAAKNDLEGRLLQSFGGNPDALTQFYRSVVNRETAGQGEIDVEYDPDNYDPTLQLQVGERTLRQNNINPSGVVPQIPNRGFFGGGAVDNQELLMALAQERISAPSQQISEAPFIENPSQLSNVPIGGLFRTMQNGKLVTVRREK